MPSQTLLHADIFFFIATIGFALITICLLICFIYIIGIFRNVKRITVKIEAGMSAVETETREMVEDLRDSMAFRMLFGTKAKHVTRKPKANASSESMLAVRRPSVKKKVKKVVQDVSDEA